jgi:zinc-ribbon domain
MYCTACGEEFPSGVDFCPHCGAPLSSAGSTPLGFAPAGSTPPGSGPAGVSANQVAQTATAWEYSESRATFPPNVIPWFSLATSRPPAHSAPPVRALRLVDIVVASLVRQKRAEGWEPAEPTDAPSLWKAGKVEFRIKRRDALWALVTFQAHFDVVLLGVRVSFRRARAGSPPGRAQTR